MHLAKLLISLCWANEKQPDIDRLGNIAACLESINMGLYLFEHLEKREELLSKIPFAGLLASKLTEKNLILSGDFFYSAA